MSDARISPAWADDLRRRYLRGESSMFVLHGNVYDTVVQQQQLLGLTYFLCDVLLKDNKDTIAVYNSATGVRFAKMPATPPGHRRRAARVTEGARARRARAAARRVDADRGPPRVRRHAGPGGRPAFQADARPRRDRDAAPLVVPARDRAGRQRRAPRAENLAELAPKLVSNPKVAVVEVPMPDHDRAARRGEAGRPASADKDADRYADLTAGLKAIQIAVDPRAAAGRRRGSRRARGVYRRASSAAAPDAAERAHKLAALTTGLAATSC